MMYQMKGLGINFTNDHNRFLYWLLCKLSAPSKLALLPWLHNIFKIGKYTKRVLKYGHTHMQRPSYPYIARLRYTTYLHAKTFFLASPTMKLSPWQPKITIATVICIIYAN